MQMPANVNENIAQKNKKLFENSYCASIVWVSQKTCVTNNISLLAQIHIPQTFRLHLFFLELFSCS